MVTDLGVSSYMKDGRCESTSGTRAYMSPEMLKSTHGICADFYALGVTLYRKDQTLFTQESQSQSDSLSLSLLISMSVTVFLLS